MAFYDTEADLTWVTNANLAQTSGYDADGYMAWADANTWAAGLTVGGVGGWRLANTTAANGTDFNYNYAADGSADRGYNISAPGTANAGSQGSELANMFYNVLGNKGYCDPLLSSGPACSGPQAGWGLTNTGPFSNVQQSNLYWSATEFALSTSTAWTFSFNSGLQNYSTQNLNYFAWAVQSGDVSAVSVPAAVWLFGSGLLGLMGVARRNKR